MHHKLIIRNGDTTKIVKDIFSVDNIEYIDEKPRAGSLNYVTSGAIAEIIPEGQSNDNPLMTSEDVERMIDVMKPINAMTLRFEFSKKDYDPDTAGVGSAGTWTKVDSPTLNIWDWTNENTDWHDSFKGAFLDEDNEVSVIASGDTSSVTSTKDMFAGQYTGNWPNHLSLTTRNNITSCVPLDLSSCTDAALMFYGSSLNDTVPIKFNSDPVNFYGLFADTLIREIKEYDFGGVENSSETPLAVFSFNSILTKVGRITGTENFNQCILFSKCPELEVIDYISPFSNATTAVGQFADIPKLKRLNFVLEMPKVTKIRSCFANCDLLEYIGGFICGEGIVTDAAGYINACHNLKDDSLPLFDTSAVTSFDHLMQGCRNIETIPDLDVSSVTNVNMAFRAMYSAKFGILEMYQKLVARGAAITNHSKCFENCGRDTEEGRAALAQIPQSWGGLAEG